jgi:hypothetical protein
MGQVKMELLPAALTVKAAPPPAANAPLTVPVPEHERVEQLAGPKLPVPDAVTVAQLTLPVGPTANAPEAALRVLATSAPVKSLLLLLSRVLERRTVPAPP